MTTRTLSKLMVAATIAIFSLSPANAHALAGTGTTSFNVSNTGSVTIGSNTSVAISGNTNSASSLTNVTVRLSYDASKLSCIGFGGSSSFPNTVSSSCANGSATISRSINGGDAPITGAFTVSTLSFTAITSGNAQVSTTSADAPYNGANDWNNATSATIVTVTPAQQPPVDPGKGGGPVNGNDGTTTGSTTGSGTTAATKTSSKATATTSTTNNAETMDGQIGGASTNSTTTPKSAASKTLGNSVSGLAEVTAHSTTGWVWAGIVALLLAAAATVYIKRFRTSRSAAAPVAKKTVTKKAPAKAKKA